MSSVDPSFRALFGRLKFTVRRHTFNQDSLSRDGLADLALVVPSSLLLLSSLELSDTTIYEPQIRALLGTASHFCEAILLD